MTMLTASGILPNLACGSRVWSAILFSSFESLHAFLETGTMLVRFFSPSGDVTGLVPHCVQSFVLRSVPSRVQNNHKRIVGFFVGHALGVLVRKVFNFQNGIGQFAVEKRVVCLLIQGMQMSRVTKPLPPHGIPHAAENNC
jgi:hypothetical protein